MRRAAAFHRYADGSSYPRALSTITPRSVVPFTPYPPPRQAAVVFLDLKRSLVTPGRPGECGAYPPDILPPGRDVASFTHVSLSRCLETFSWKVRVTSGSRQLRSRITISYSTVGVHPTNSELEKILLCSIVHSCS